MKISIVVPVYNVQEYLPKCLDSLINQKYDDFEIVCVDDGSNDNSLQVLKSYEEKYGDILKVYTKENGGLADTRNYGIDKSNGDYVGFVDSDDWVDCNMFKDMMDIAILKSADIVVCDYTEVYESEERLIRDNNDGNKILYESLVCNKIFKKELFQRGKIKFPIGLWYEDNATTYKLLFLAENVQKVDKSYYFYRRTRPNSIMNSQNSPKIYDMWDIANDLAEFFKKYNKSKEEEAQIEYIFIRNILFRQIPKIVKFELPNLFRVKKQLKQHYSLLEKYYPKWYENEILKKDENRYFFNKIGKNHVKKIFKFKKSLRCLVMSVIFK